MIGERPCLSCRTDIETRQTKGCAQHPPDCDRGAERAEFVQLPDPYKEGWCDSKGNNVGEGIKLRTEVAGPVEPPRHATVQGIEHSPENNKHRRRAEYLGSQISSPVYEEHGIETTGDAGRSE